MSLVVALVAIVGLGLWVLLDHRQSSAEQSAMAAVTAFMDAKNQHDPAAVAAATTDDVTMSGLATTGLVDEGPFRGTEFTTAFTNTMGPTFHMEAIGPGAMVGTDLIAVPTRVQVTSGGYDRDGIAVYRVQDVDGTMKVSRIAWLAWSDR